MKITNRIFDKLAIIMVCFGILVGCIFPFFCILIGSPKKQVLLPIFFISCIIAGVLLGIINIVIARKVIGSPLKKLSQKMGHVKDILGKARKDEHMEVCDPSTCYLSIDSDDELGECANSFNKLVATLVEVLATNSEINTFIEMLTSHLELDVLSNETLDLLIKNMNSAAGAILIEKNGEIIVEAISSIKNPELLVINDGVKDAFENNERQILEFPTDVLIDGVLVDSKPKEIMIEPIAYKKVLLGVIILANTESFSKNSIEKLTVFSHSLALAFRNAITHNQMKNLAAIDPLTSLYNRRFGIMRLQEEFSRAIRNGAPVSLLLFDIDDFKKVNDVYGHLIGDKVLISISKSASVAIREGDVLLRFGGEEFLCILPGANQTDAKRIAERIRVMVMDSSVKNGDQDVKVTISIGIATFPHNDIANQEDFIKLADEAMYSAKESGKNCIVAY